MPRYLVTGMPRQARAHGSAMMPRRRRLLRYTPQAVQQDVDAWLFLAKQVGATGQGRPAASSNPRGNASIVLDEPNALWDGTNTSRQVVPSEQGEPTRGYQRVRNRSR